MRSILFGLLLAVLVAAAPANAAKAIYFVDYTHGPDVVGAALAAGGHTVTQATSWTAFSDALWGGQYDLAIGLAQNMPAVGYGLDPAAVADHVQRGGGFIFATWTTSDNPVVNVLGFTFTGNTNLTQVTITDPGLAAGVTNPIVLSNPSWGIFSRGLDGTSLATFENGDDAIATDGTGRTLCLGFLEDTMPVEVATPLWQNMIARVVSHAHAPATIPVQTPVGLGLLAALLAAGGVFAVRRLA